MKFRKAVSKYWPDPAGDDDVVSGSEIVRTVAEEAREEAFRTHGDPNYAAVLALADIVQAVLDEIPTEATAARVIQRSTEYAPVSEPGDDE